MTTPLDERLAVVRERIVAAGGDLARVRIVAVSKGVAPPQIIAALEAGVVDLGESYAQELLGKVLPGELAPQWHFLGHIQRNKVKALAPLVHLWHGVDRVAAGREIATHKPGAAVLVQVDCTGAAGRNGARPADVPALVDELGALGLDVCGLMCVAGRDEPRREFAAVAALGAGLGLRELSMGMSGDLEAAVAEGSTMVRVGTALFGPRPGGPRVSR